MATRPRPATVGRLAGAALLLALVLPPAASAANADPNGCNEGMAVTYTAGAPAGLRTLGSHRIEWHSEYTDLEGTFIAEELAENAITVANDAPAYPNTVLIRLFRNTTLVNREVVDVDAMRPTQDARLYANVSWLRDEPFFVGEFRLWFRYETTRNHWSNWIATSASSTKSFCVEVNSAIWKRGYGWE